MQQLSGSSFSTVKQSGGSAPINDLKEHVLNAAQTGQKQELNKALSKMTELSGSANPQLRSTVVDTLIHFMFTAMDRMKPTKADHALSSAALKEMKMLISKDSSGGITRQLAQELANRPEFDIDQVEVNRLGLDSLRDSVEMALDHVDDTLMVEDLNPKELESEPSPQVPVFTNRPPIDYI